MAFKGAWKPFFFGKAVLICISHIIDESRNRITPEPPSPFVT